MKTIGYYWSMAEQIIYHTEYILALSHFWFTDQNVDARKKLMIFDYSFVIILVNTHHIETAVADLKHRPV